ncbi:aldo/keto reductase [Geodermatophilus sabuli]|uniref:Predicted oxidoreductase n=1 Tax=Geodermatophilus sabuli TaxID=1564158 RepID=A0A285ED73_9ACTN|nr:aldo/keto reductase [Geodermatophilus sabuli]MBB3083329.1 aryl-alcohol dehydrogenase-like predicted oxidoreductase [Geodermatophilus sabuli]SNX96950.1 Predicted oxidoreductase [Geodermatophilus sabuli]
MEYTHLGRSGLSVSRLCLGTMNFGWKTEEADAHAIMDRAHADGVNFFDTANTYGFDAGKGRTEEVLGTWFALGGQRRDKTVLATKVYGSMTEWPNDTFLSARNLVRSCEASLRRMQTDWIDLYQFHHVDLATPWEEIWQACETLVAQGKVLYVGSSNHAAWQIAAANEAAARRHFVGLVSEQSHYNLLTRHVELEVLPAAQHYGVGIIPWSPLAGGLLAGVLAEEGGDRRRAAEQRVEEHRPALQAYEDACREWGLAPADVGVAWLLHQPAVTAPIVGPRTMAQFEGALGALDVHLDGVQLARLDEIFPGYRAAPMEYAW